VSLPVRLFGRQAISIGSLISLRDFELPGLGDRTQAVQTVTLSYNLLGPSGFGAVECRPAEPGTAPRPRSFLRRIDEAAEVGYRRTASPAPWLGPGQEEDRASWRTGS
jgi:hypothetical protein